MGRARPSREPAHGQSYVFSKGGHYTETERASTGDSTHDDTWSKDGLLRCSEGGTLAGSYGVEIAGDPMTFKGRTPSEDTARVRG